MSNVEQNEIVPDVERECGSSASSRRSQSLPAVK